MTDARKPGGEGVDNAHSAPETVNIEALTAQKAEGKAHGGTISANEDASALSTSVRVVWFLPWHTGLLRRYTRG